MPDATHQVVVVERVVPMEEVEVLTSVQTGEGLFTAGQKCKVFASQVSALVLSGGVKRLSATNATDDEKAFEARARVTVLEQEAVEANKTATEALSAAVSSGNRDQQEAANKMVLEAIRVKNEAIKAAHDMNQAEEARAKAKDESKEVKMERARADQARTAITPSAGPK